MTTEARIKLTSSELSTLWMTYESTSALLIIHDSIKDKIIDKDAQHLLNSYVNEARNIKNKIVSIFNNEKAAIPIGFDEQDVVRDAPPLFDDIFYMMFLRQMMKLNFGHSALFSAMSYMSEVHDVLKLNYDIADKYYVFTTNYLLGKGVLAKPPYITMPRQAEFIEDKSYMSGLNIFSDKRSLNAIEVGYLNEALEYNIFSMQLLKGFTQVATEDDVKKYFKEGKEFAKKIITELSEILLQSDIQPPSTWAGKATDSNTSPFSDKLMMYISSLISATAIGFHALGTSFSMRSDLHAKLALISKDTFDLSKKGGEIMIAHKWMEKPPQM